jgi:hypothetical protein
MYQSQQFIYGMTITSFFGDAIWIDKYTISIYGLDELSFPWVPRHLSS